MRIALIWEACVGGCMFLVGSFMAANPRAYLNLRSHLSWFGPLVQSRDLPGSWTLRTRLLGLMLVLFGIVLLNNVGHGHVPPPLPPGPYMLH